MNVKQILMNFNYKLSSVIGNVDRRCFHCGAKLFSEECDDMSCCRSEVKLDPPDPPESLSNLFDGTYEKSDTFYKN